MKAVHRKSPLRSICVPCGKSMPRKKLLKHFSEVHGKTSIARRPGQGIKL
jgi:hypothetical protein